MTIRRKAVGIIAGVLGLVFVVAMTLGGALILRRALFNETSQVQRQIRRAHLALLAEISALDRVAGDYAGWDDTYRFVVERNPDYIQDNLGAATFIKNGFSYVVLADAAGQIVHAQGVDPATGNTIPVPAGLLREAAPGSRLLQHSDPKSSIHGILVTEDTPLLIASRPVLTSQYEGPIRGTLIFGKPLDAPALRALAKQTLLELRLDSLDSAELPSALSAVFRAPDEWEPMTVRARDRHVVEGWMLLRDIFGRPATVLGVISPRSFLRDAEADLALLWALLAILGLAAALTALWLLDHLVLVPTARLAEFAGRISAGGSHQDRMSVSGNDELAGLSQAFNRMLDAIQAGQTEREQSRHALLESEERLASIFRGSAIPAFVLDHTHRVILWNMALEKLTGFSAASMIGTDRHWEAFYNEKRPCMADLLLDGHLDRLADWYGNKWQKSKLLDEAYEATDFFRRLAPHGRWVRFTTAAVRDPRGKLIGAIETLEDITPQRQAEELLKLEHELSQQLAVLSDSQEALRRILDIALGIEGLDCGGIYLVNPDGSLEMTVHQGLSPEFVSRVARLPADSPQAQVVAGGKPVYGRHAELVNSQDEIRNREGLRALAVIPVLHQEHAIAVINAASHVCDTIPDLAREILETLALQLGDAIARIRAEEELRAERRLFMAGPVIVIKWKNQPDWPVEYVSPNIAAQFGHNARDLRSGAVRYLDLLHPDDTPRILAEVTAHVDSGKIWYEQEYRLRRKDGEYRWVHDFTAVIRNAAGQITHFHGYIQDITDRRRNEERHRQLEMQIQQTQKLESLGVLAGGIAHDFNNLLMTILGNADLALSALPPDTPVRDTIQDIIQGSHRAAELCRQMLAYSGRGRLIVEPVDLSRLVREMTHMLEVAIAKNVVLRCNLSDDLPAIEGDATQLRQVVMNLIINASEAIGKRSGYVAVTTALKQCDESFLHSCFLGEHLPPGRYVILQVEDTGCGMDDETRARIFDPFFSTKFTGRGLGLSAVLGIVRGHQGAISVESQPGEGTKFTMLFPASSKPVTAAPAPAESEWRRCGTVLIVDDEDAVRLLARKMVKMCGLKTLLARDGREAVAVFKEKAAEIDCVLLDLTMPHMDGEEAFKAMRAIRPDARIIVSSGYSEQDISERFTLDAKVTFIQKPYARGPLVAALKKVLGEKPPPAG